MGFSTFWELTPADVMIAIEAHERRERGAYWRAGLITAALINVHRDKGSRPAKPEDFVPRRQRQIRHEQTPEQMAAILKALTIASGGEVQC